MKDSQRSILGKWALQRRIEAHVTTPGLAGLLLLIVYFVSPAFFSLMFAPGAFALPLGDGRSFGLFHLLMGGMLCWIGLLAFSTLTLTRDIAVWLLSLLVLVALFFLVVMWLDGHSLSARVSALWLIATDQGGSWSDFIREQQALLDLAGLAAFSFLFFVLLPLLYGSEKGPVVSTLVPSRWLILSTLIMFIEFWLAWRVARALPGDIPYLVMPLFTYVLVLYMARVQYRTWVRREAQNWQR